MDNKEHDQQASNVFWGSLILISVVGIKFMTIQSWFVVALILVVPLVSVFAEMKRYLKSKRINHKK